MIAKVLRMTKGSLPDTLRGTLLAAGLALAVSGCVSLGEDPPASLLTLAPTSFAPAGAALTGTNQTLLAVLEPDAPQRLNVTRVPVRVSPSSIAYLQDAQWVDKPARLFQRLLAETIRSKGERMVVDSGDLQYAAATKLSGQLTEMGFDAATNSVIVRFDGVLVQADGTVLTQRFEANVPGISAQAGPVGVALNQAANDVAAQVAEWVG